MVHGVIGGMLDLAPSTEAAVVVEEGKGKEGALGRNVVEEDVLEVLFRMLDATSAVQVNLS